VAVSDQSLSFAPNPHEVAEIIELPLTQLVDPASRGRHIVRRSGLEFSVPHFAIAGRHVWGATSLILAEFLALFRGADAPVCRE
jgi:hypothetical protein